MNKIIGNAIPILNLNDLNFSAERAGEKLTTPDGGKNTNVLEIQKQESISKKSSKVIFNSLNINVIKFNFRRIKKVFQFSNMEKGRI